MEEQLIDLERVTFLLIEATVSLSMRRFLQKLGATEVDGIKSILNMGAFID